MSDFLVKRQRQKISQNPILWMALLIKCMISQTSTKQHLILAHCVTMVAKKRLLISLLVNTQRHAGATVRCEFY